MKPGVLVGRMVHHEFGYHAEPPMVGFAKECPEVPKGPVRRVDTRVVGSIVAVVFEGRRREGEKVRL